MKMADLPKEERPLERLSRLGVEALQFAELLCLVLGGGGGGRSALEIAQEMIARFGCGRELGEITLSELMQLKGVGLMKAGQIKAAIGIGRRLYRSGGDPKYGVESPGDVVGLADYLFRAGRKEMMAIILRNKRGDVFHHEQVATGNFAELRISPRELFTVAIHHGAVSFILIHCHPSGEQIPSTEDLNVTKTLIEMGKILKVEVDDHIIISKYNHVSLWERGFVRYRMRY